MTKKRKWGAESALLVPETFVTTMAPLVTLLAFPPETELLCCSLQTPVYGVGTAFSSLLRQEAVEARTNLV